MKKKTFTQSRMLNYYFVLFAVFVLSFHFNLKAQDPDCEVSSDMGLGYTSIIKEVVDLGGDNYTITIAIFFDGCPGPGCKNVSFIALEGDPGTYSNVSAIAYVGGDVFSPGVNLGPGQGGVPFQGMKISGLGNFGKVNGAEVLITYTLSGGFQNQQTMVKAGSKKQYGLFEVSDFQSVLDCNSSNVFPYYPPPEGGKAGNDCVILGPELCSFYDTFINLGQVVTDDIFQTDGVSVLIVVEAVDGQLNNLLAELTSPSIGMTDAILSTIENTVTGNTPILNLLLINDLSGIAQEARPVYQPLASSGIVTSQGDVSMRADLARAVFGVGGDGVKIGVISDSYNTLPGDPANDDVVRGDLPGIGVDAVGNSVPNPQNDTPVEVLDDFPSTLSDEGRAMLQIIHDVAPQADLAFHTGFRSDVDFAQAILDLAASGCDIICDDVTYIEEPFFRDGLVAQAAETVSGAGVSYFTAAGNFGTRGYLSPFTGVPAPTGLTGQAHNFEAAAGGPGTDIYQSVDVPEGSYTLVLQYDDGQPYGSAVADVDIYLARDDGSPLFGFNRDNIGGRQLEVLPFTVGPGGATTNIIIINASSTPGLTIQYTVFRGLLTQNEWGNAEAPTLVGQANAESTIAVGAVLFSNTPPFGVDPPTPASFSSRGGTPVNGVVRNKPNIMGPNGTNTTVELGGLNIDGDAFPNFFGTSAAAPHVAAVGALLTQAQEEFYPGTTMTPALMKSILEGSARDMESPGFDASSGYGFIEADAALLTLANPSPLIYDLIFDETVTPGLESFELTITGEYLTDEAIVYIDGEAVTNSTTISPDGTTITTTIDPFGPLVNQTIQVGNPATTPSGLDGGLSEPLYFTDKPSVVITISDKSKVYGEELPEFTAESIDVVQLDGTTTPLVSSGLTAAEIARIQAIQFEAPNVSALTNSGLWAIKAVTTDPLNPLSSVTATDPLDVSLLEQYNFAIFDGLLTVENLEMTIIPKEKTITFGEEIGDFEFDYNFNDDPSNPLNITPDIETAITSAVSTAHATVLVNARATALVNASATALVNYSFLISATALVNSNDDVYDLQLSNAAATALVNGNATPLVNGAATATVLVNGVSRATVLVNATALVNGTATVLVNGTATPLVNATALVNANATALVNSSTINGNSNSQAIVILGEEDIEVLLGNQPGDIVLKSLNLVPSTDVGSHWVLPGSLIYPNLNITYDAGGPLNVLPAPAEVTFDPISLSQVYDGTPKSVLPLSAPEGLLFDVLYDGESDLPFEAGTYEVTATVNDLNYIGTASTQLVIDPAELTVAADERFKTYGMTDPDLTYQITDGTLYGEDGFTGSLTRETGEDAGVYAIQQGDLTAGPNYNLTFAGNNLTIDPALITVTADPQSKTYGESDPPLTYLVTEGALVGEDGFTGMLSRAEGEDVGVYPIQQGDLSAGTNYTLTFVGNNLTIDPALITVTADPQSKTYGASDPLLTYQITSGALVPGDNFSGLLIREPGENAGTYAILQGDLSVSDNYMIAYVGNNFVINAADITVTADDQSKTYGEADPELTFSVTSGALVGEDSFNGTLTRESGEHVGSYSITQGSLSAGDNYNLTVVSGTLTIDPRSLTVAAVDDHKTYGEPDPFFTYQILSGSLINGDALSGHVDRASGEDAGTYAITQGTLDAGSNYDLIFVDGTFTINKAWLLIKVSPKYQWTFEGDPDPDITFAFFGFVNGDDENDLTSLGYVTWPNYSGQCGIYKVFPQATSPNYDISIKKGYLIVYEYDGITGGGGQTEDPMYKTSDLDLVEVSEITAYPNPASSQVYLKLNGNTVTSDDILVFDIQGNQVRIDDIRPSGGTMELDISRLETGVYFIHINLETDKQLIRIIKQ